MKRDDMSEQPGSSALSPGAQPGLPRSKEPAATPVRAPTTAPVAQSPSPTASVSRALVFRLLRAGARLALRAGMPLQDILKLTRTAVFAEAERREPDVENLAQDLDISVRTGYSLRAQLRKETTERVRIQEDLRRVLEHFSGSTPKSSESLAGTLPDLDSARLQEAIGALVTLGWLKPQGACHFVRSAGIQVMTSEALERRLDAASAQLEVLTASLWNSFATEAAAATESANTYPTTLGKGRTWTFLAHPEAMTSLVQNTVTTLRTQTIAAEEAAHESREGVRKVGITLALTTLPE